MPRNPLLVTCFIGLLVLVVSPLSQASIVTFNYIAIISGDTPAGTSPWVTATFDDGGSSGTVTLTMSASGLVPNENISGMYFNLDPALNLGSLSFAYQSSTGPAATSIQTGTNGYKADGDGAYDVLFNFPTGSGFDAGETVQYKITGIPTLTASSFNFLSACGNPNCTGPGNFYAAAKVQNTPGTSGSSWVASNAGNVGVVPIPAAVWLFGSGLMGLAAVVRRKRRV